MFSMIASFFGSNTNLVGATTGDKQPEEKKSPIASPKEIRDAANGFLGMTDEEVKAARKSGGGIDQASKRTHQLVAHNMPLPTRIEMWLESKTPTAYVDGAVKWTLRGVAVVAIVKVVRLGIDKIFG